MKSEIPDCGHREISHHIADGQCRDCRGVAKPDPVRSRTYRSPEYRERNAEALAHREQRSRHAVLSNRSGADQ